MKITTVIYRLKQAKIIQDIIILYDHNTYFLSSPVCQTCLIDLYRKMTDQFRPELFDDSGIGECPSNSPFLKNNGGP